MNDNYITNIQHFNDRTEVSHFLSNKDLRARIELTKEKLKEVYSKYISDIKISWIDLNNYILGTIKIYDSTKTEFNSKIKLEYCKLTIFLPTNPFLKMMIAIKREKINQHFEKILYALFVNEQPIEIQPVQISHKPRFRKRRIPPKPTQ